MYVLIEDEAHPIELMGDIRLDKLIDLPEDKKWVAINVLTIYWHEWLPSVAQELMQAFFDAALSGNLHILG